YSARNPTSLVSLNRARFVGCVLAVLSAESAAQTAGRWSALPVPGSPFVTAIAIDSRDSSTIFAGTEDRGIFRSTDGGASWISVRSGMRDVFVESIAIDPADSSRIFASASTTTSSPGGPVTTGGIYRSTDGGLTWSRVLDQFGPIAIAPTSSSTV